MGKVGGSEPVRRAIDSGQSQPQHSVHSTVRRDVKRACWGWRAACEMLNARRRSVFAETDRIRGIHRRNRAHSRRRAASPGGRSRLNIGSPPFGANPQGRKVPSWPPPCVSRAVMDKAPSRLARRDATSMLLLERGGRRPARNSSASGRIASMTDSEDLRVAYSAGSSSAFLWALERFAGRAAVRVSGGVQLRALARDSSAKGASHSSAGGARAPTSRSFHTSVATRTLQQAELILAPLSLGAERSPCAFAVPALVGAP